MGLKITAFDIHNLCPLFVKIRPRWDWKSKFSLPSPRPINVKIRPRWDWKPPTTKWEEDLKSLKSDQDGIENFSAISFASFSSFSLKSDQDGIENQRATLRHWEYQQLKSDQDGIENIRSHLNSYATLLVKIRPRWYWKGQGFSLRSKCRQG